ncbi:MAG: phosphoadenosine phosphosulfate reductase family protein [Clostridia bacterium]
MIKYKCNKCNGLQCETSTCPVCGERAEVEETKLYWCSSCNTPMFFNVCKICNEKTKYIGTDLRPVFPEERLLLEILLGTPMKYAGKSVWNASGNRYIVNGKKISVKLSNLVQMNNEEVIKNIEKYKEENKEYEDNFFDNQYIKKYIEANKIWLNDITNEAYAYIRKIAENYAQSEMFVSFSGGKDSTVTSDVVMKALGKKDIIHIYGNTTLEYPETLEYIAKFKKINPETPILVAKNKEQDFNEICKLVGPPSRMMRWCCTIFKTGAITRKIDSTFKNEGNVLTFYGIRRSESTSRSKYERDSISPKIVKQRVVSPIIDWIDFDIWLYLISNKIEFNKAYRLGFTRVGCWCCPNNSTWSEYLASIYMKKEYDVFHNILLDFAKSVGKKDAKIYVNTGKWKARQGGNGVKYSKHAIVEFKPCALEENTMNFDLTRDLDESIYELFKPFGKLDFNIGKQRLNEVFVLNRKTEKPLLKLSGILGQRVFKVTILSSDFGKNKKNIEMLIKNQIIKFQTCIGCLACEAVCKFNAIKISKIEDKLIYKINDEKCVGCLECVNHFDSGCYMKKILRVKEVK